MAHLALVCLLTACAPAEQSLPRVHFVEVAQPAGLTLRNTCGSPDKRYIVEAKGGSLAAFDYDQDGDLDLYIVNGSTLEGFPPETAPPQCSLPKMPVMRPFKT